MGFRGALFELRRGTSSEYPAAGKWLHWREYMFRFQHVDALQNFDARFFCLGAARRRVTRRDCVRMTRSGNNQ